MSRQRILEWERRWALPAALCAFGGAALFIGSTVVAQQGVSPVATNSELLREFEDARSSMLGAAVLNAVALLLLAPVLYYLFHAASARSPAVRRGLVGVVVAGPLFFGLAEILQCIALNGAANDFATPGGGAGVPIGEYAEDLIREQTTFGFAQGFSFAGVIALGHRHDLHLPVGDAHRASDALHGHPGDGPRRLAGPAGAGVLAAGADAVVGLARPDLPRQGARRASAGVGRGRGDPVAETRSGRRGGVRARRRG